MRKLLTWLVVTLGIAAVVRRLRRRQEALPPASVQPAEDPAAELRRKLAESRADAAPAAPAPESSVSERRAAVHDEGHAALDEMRAQDQGE
jgi:hypothetical protein